MQRIALFLCAIAIAACSSSSSNEPGADAGGTGVTFDGTPLAVVDGDAAKVHVELRTGPDQPPSRGVETVALTVTDSAGKALDGLTIDVVPWMPAMGHGASVKPAVTAVGNGRYLVDNVDFVMPGQWQIRMTFSGAIEDHAISVLQIP